MEIFEKSNIKRVFSQVNQTFKSSPRRISILDEKENPSNRMTEINPGTLSGISKTPSKEEKVPTDFEYSSWDLPKSDFQDFVKYANSGKPFERCRNTIAQSGFLIDNVQENEITGISSRVEWISATAYIDGSINGLKLYIRIKYIPPLSEDELRRSIKVLEKAVEIYFLELKGFSHEMSPCMMPVVPKVISLSVFCSHGFMDMLAKEFNNSRSKGKFNLNGETKKVVSLLGYDGAENPSVICESENLYHVVWKRSFSQDSNTFFLVDFTDLEKFIVERKRHTLPIEASIIRGTTDLISDILSYVSFWFASLKFYESKNLDSAKALYIEIWDDFLKNFQSRLTKKDNKMLFKLVEIQTKLQKSQTYIEETFERLPEFYPFLLRFYEPEVPVSHLSIFESAKLTENERVNMPYTFSQSLDVLKRRENTDMKAKLSKLTESVEKTMALINSRIQIKVTKMNTYLVGLTAFLVSLAIINLVFVLLGLKF